jgi:hypothetical protein
VGELGDPKSTTIAGRTGVTTHRRFIRGAFAAAGGFTLANIVHSGRGFALADPDISPGGPRIARLVRKIMVFTFDHGCEVGNQTMTHSSDTPRGEVCEIGPAQHVLHDVTGVYRTFLHAAGGTMHPSVDQKCERNGHTYIWTDTGERDSNMPRIAAETINANLARALHPGYISLRHSGGMHDDTATSMHHAIDLVEQAGYHATRSTFAWTQATQQAPISTALTTVPGMSPVRRHRRLTLRAPTVGQRSISVRMILLPEANVERRTMIVRTPLRRSARSLHHGCDWAIGRPPSPSAWP